ncbi:MAG: hypothetical protein ACI4WM_03885 [Erysipelotrichaceae bacterium]
MEEKIRRIFESGFDIKKNVRIKYYRFEYIACRYDIQGRTMAVSKKEIDKYVLRENVYFIKMKINEETFKKEMEKLFKTLKDSVDIVEDHYETLFNVVIFTELNTDLKKMIKRYQKTELIKFGLNGAFIMRLIGIDQEKKEICGNATNELLMKKLKGVF